MTEKKYDFLPEKHEELIAPVLQSYRITIPQDYRKAHGIKVGDKVKLIFSDKVAPLIIVPVDVQVIVREKVIE